MAKLECQLHGNFNEILNRIEQEILNGSVSATLEDSSDIRIAGCKCAVRVYERYAWSGGNRVSLNVTLLEVNGVVFLSAITSGGSQAVFFKFNTWGEETFLSELEKAVSDYM